MNDEEIIRLPDETSAAKALRLLALTDADHAKAKAAVKRLEKAEKIVYAAAYIATTGKAEDRKSSAYATPEYQKWLDNYEAAVIAFQLLENRRDRYLHHFEFYRSLNANRRMAGNV